MYNSPPIWEKEGLEHVWLPYTQMQTAPVPLPVISADGSYIKLADGRELLDGVSSWWSVCHGYNHPKIIKAMQAQLKTLPHIMFAGLAHEPAYTLAKRLAEITPRSLNRVFFADSGSVAIEVAMKMAVQYWQNKRKTSKNKFISFKNAYHGDTMGAMSLADPNDSMHTAFTHFTPKQYVLDIPNDEYSFVEFEEIVKGISKTTAGMIIEPLVQGAGGMKFHSADILAALRKICKKYDILFIADEIFTGFARTGMMFACDEAGISPDIMCVGKALTGGTISLAATLASDEIFSAFLSEKPEAAFMHGPTYMANPLACAAANASLDLFAAEPRIKQVEEIEKQLTDELAPCKKFENVKDIRVKGAIGVVELAKTNPDYIFAIREKFIEEGIWLRPFGNIIYTTPPLTMTNKELAKITGAICKILKG